MQQSGPRQGSGEIGIAKILSEHICVVYHSETGDIMHTHRVVNMVGANAREAPEIEARAIELAISVGQGRDRSKMKTLLLRPGEIVPSGRYTVDLLHKKLVAMTDTGSKK